MKSYDVEFLEAFADTDMLMTALFRLFILRGTKQHLSRIDGLLEYTNVSDDERTAMDHERFVKPILHSVRDQLARCLEERGEL